MDTPRYTNIQRQTNVLTINKKPTEASPEATPEATPEAPTEAPTEATEEAPTEATEEASKEAVKEAIPESEQQGQAEPRKSRPESRPKADSTEPKPKRIPIIDKYADFYREHISDRFVFFQGGKRSGKTHFICQLVRSWAFTCRGCTVFCIAPDYPRMVDLRLSFEKATGLMVRGSAEGFICCIGESRIFFRAFDRPEKAEQGKECDFAYFYECRSISLGVVRGIMAGCRIQAVGDYNPCEVFWKDDYYPDAPTLVTTYRDNQYLTDAQRSDYIEAERRAALPTATDYDRWWADVFCFGRLNQKARLCFERSELVREKEFRECIAPCFLAVDFGGEQGGADPTALIAVKVAGQNIYIHELLYSNKAGDKALGEAVARAVKDLQPKCLVYETATNGKRRVAEVMRMGDSRIPTFPAIKGAGSVESGIEELQAYTLLITDTSENVWNERNEYRYVMKDGSLVPMDRCNHSFDALRYFMRYYAIKGCKM